MYNLQRHDYNKLAPQAFETKLQQPIRQSTNQALVFAGAVSGNQLMLLLGAGIKYPTVYWLIRLTVHCNSYCVVCVERCRGTVLICYTFRDEMVYVLMTLEVYCKIQQQQSSIECVRHIQFLQQFLWQRYITLNRVVVLPCLLTTLVNKSNSRRSSKRFNTLNLLTAPVRSYNIEHKV